MAEVVVGQTDSLSAYLQTAARNNPSVQQRWSDYQAALQKVPQVGSLPDPDLNLGFFLQPMELPGGNQVADLQLMQMFPWFGVLKNAKDEMGLMAKAALASVQEAKLQVFYEVRTTWYALYQNREQRLLTQRNLDLLRQLERLARSRYGSGTSIGVVSAGSTPEPAQPTGGNGGGMSGMAAANPSAASATAPMTVPGMPSTGLSELYALQSDELELTNRLESLDDAYQNLQFRFNKLLNRSEKAEVVLPETLDDVFQAPVDSALQQNPMLEMLRFERASLEARRKMSERMGYPMVGVGLKYSVLAKNPASTSMMNGQDMLMPMLSVSLPIYRKKYKAVQQETEWRRTATEQNVEALTNQLQTDFHDALLNLRDAQRRQQLYDGQRPLTEKAYQLQLKRFAASSGTLAELMSLSRQLLDFSLKSLDAKVDKLNAQAKLRQLTAQD